MKRYLSKMFARFFVTMCYQEVGRPVPPAMKNAIDNGIPHKVEVVNGVLTASINGIPQS